MRFDMVRKLSTQPEITSAGALPFKHGLMVALSLLKKLEFGQIYSKRGSISVPISYILLWDYGVATVYGLLQVAYQTGLSGNRYPKTRSHRLTIMFPATNILTWRYAPVLDSHRFGFKQTIPDDGCQISPFSVGYVYIYIYISISTNHDVGPKHIPRIPQQFRLLMGFPSFKSSEKILSDLIRLQIPKIKFQTPIKNPLNKSNLWLVKYLLSHPFPLHTYTSGSKTRRRRTSSGCVATCCASAAQQGHTWRRKGETGKNGEKPLENI